MHCHTLGAFLIGQFILLATNFQTASTDLCDIGFVLDTSGSISKDDFVKQKEFVNRLVTSFGFENRRYGIVLFSFLAEMPIKFTDYNRLETFKAAVLKLPQARSITRIDRGLLLAQHKLFTKEGGHRPNANKVLFLLTDGSQTYSSDVVNNTLISKNLRYSGTEFLVLGIGKGVNEKELTNIAGGKEMVYIVDSFDKLKSQDFINSFNISCSLPGFSNRKTFYLYINFINGKSSEVTFNLVNKNGKTLSYKIPGKQQKIYKHEVLSQRAPFLSVSGQSEGSVIPNLNGRDSSLRFQYNPVEMMEIVRIQERGLTASRGYRIFVHFFNQLSYTVYLKCTFNGNVVARYTIAGYRYYYVESFYVQSPGTIYFTVSDTDDNVVTVNGNKQAQLKMESQIYIYRPTLFTNRFLSHPLKTYTYGATFRILNIGRYNLMFNYQQTEFSVARNSRETKTVKTVGKSQPTSFKLFVRRENQDKRYFVLDILPTEEGSEFYIVIGNHFDYYLPRSFDIKYHNLVNQYLPVAEMLAGGSTMTFGFQAEEKIKSVNVYMIYAKPEPSYDITGYYNNEQGSRKSLFINGKPRELVGADSIRLSKDTDVYLSQFKVQRKRFWGYVENKVNSEIIVRWEVDDNIKLTMKEPENDRIYLPRATKFLLLMFWNYQDMKGFRATAFDRRTKKTLMINGAAEYRGQVHLRRPNPLPRLVVTAAPFYYYSTFAVTNNLKHTVILSWDLQSKIGDLVSVSSKTHEVKPGTKEKEIKITFTSPTKLTDEELKVAEIKVSATKIDKTTPVFVNKKEFSLVPVTPKEDRQTLLEFSKAEFKFLINVDVENLLPTAVTLNVNSNMADLRFRQEPTENRFVISPKVKSQKITLTFYTSFEDGFRDKIPDFMTFDAAKQKVLLNGKKHVTFDALENERIQKLKITKKEDSKSFIYYCRITPVNNYNRPVLVTFSPSIYGEFILSSTKDFIVYNDGNARKPDTIFLVESSRVLTDKELKGLVRISASDTSLRTPVLSNGKKVIFLNAVPGKSGSSNAEEVKFEVKGYELKIPFTVYSDVSNEVVQLQWTYKNGVQLPNIAPMEIQLVSKESIQQTIYFTLILPAMLQDNDLFTFKARSRKTNELFLINGNRDLKTGLVSREALNGLHLVITNAIGTSYYANVRVENTLNRPVQFQWNTLSSQSPSLYQSQRPTKSSFQLQSLQKETYILKVGSSVPMTDDQLVNAIRTYAFVDGDDPSKTGLIVNGKQGAHRISLSKDKESAIINIRIEEPKEYKYTYYFEAISYYSSPVTLSWKYRNPNQNYLSTKSPTEFVLQSTQSGKLDFVSTVPLSRDELRSALYLQARAAGKPGLMVNNQEKYKIVLRPFSGRSDVSYAPEKIIINDKGFALKKRYINLEFTNTESFPITIRSSLVMSKFEMFLGNNPDTFVVDGAGVGNGAVGPRKRITLSFWVYGQDVLNMKDSNMLELSASYNDHTMYMNGREGFFYLKTSHLQETSSGDYIQIKLSAPKEFQTNLELSISNILPSTILFKWELSNPRIETSVSKSPTMKPGSGKITFTFKSQTPFSRQALNNLVKLYAVRELDKQPVELNSKSFLVITPFAPSKLTKNVSVRISAKAFYYYSTFAVTNNLKHTVILSWDLQSKMGDLLSVSSKTHEVKPGTEEKEIKIIFTSSTKLTDEELKVAKIKVSATKIDKTTPVFVNKKEFSLVPVTLKEDRQTLLEFSNAEFKFFINVDVENLLLTAVTLNVNSNMADLRFRQEPTENRFVISPKVKSQKITLTFFTSFEDGFKDKIPDFMTFDAAKQKVLLNGKEYVTFDALKNERILTIKITKKEDSKSFIYSCRITPVNNYNRPVLVTFSPSIYGEFILSSTKDFIVSNDGNARKPDTIFLVESSRVLTDKELKGLVRISASDTSLKTPVLSNGKKVIFLNAVPGKSGSSNAEEVKFEVKGYELKIPFTVYSDVSNEVVQLQWTYKDGVQLPNIAPMEIQLVSKESIQQTIYFTLTLPAMLQDDDLFTFKARNRKTNELFLINGNRDLKTGLVSREALNGLHLVITNAIGTSYYANVRVENTLNRPVQFEWNTLSSQYPSLYQSQQPTKSSFQLQPLQKETYILKAGSSVPMTDDQLVNAIRTYAFVNGDDPSKTGLIVNGKQGAHRISLSRDKGSANINIRIEEPKEYKYTYYFEAISYYSSPVTLSWKYRNPNQNYLSTKSPTEFVLQSTQSGKLDFVSTVPLSRDELRSALYLQARAAGKPGLMVNNQEKYKIVLRPFSGRSDVSYAPEKISINDKGFALKKRYINLEFTNTESFPITIRSSLVMSKFEMFFGNNPDTFVVDGAGVGSGAVGARKRITLSFWVYGQDVLNMKDSNMLELSASYNDHTMYMNGREGSFYLKTSHLQETSSGDYIQIKLSAPKEFQTNLELSISNILPSTLLFKWELSNPRIETSVSKSPRMQPGREEITFIFKSQTPFSRQALNNLMKLYAISERDKQPVELNSKSFLVITPFAPSKLTKNVAVRISTKEHRFPVNIRVVNSLSNDKNSNNNNNDDDEITFSARFPKGSPYTLISQPTFTVPSKGSKTITFFVSGPEQQQQSRQPLNLMLSASIPGGDSPSSSSSSSSSKEEKTEPLLINGKDGFTIVQQPTKESLVDAIVTKSENFFHVQFAVENTISDLVRLSWELLLPQTSSMKQITPKSNQVFVQPGQKRIITVSFKSMNSDETDRSQVIKSLLRLKGTNEISNVQVLLNSNREVRLDASKEKKTSQTFVISSYDINNNDEVHRYSLSIKPSTDGVDKPYVLRWNFQVIDDSITSDSPRKFVIDPTKGKPQKDVQIVVQSNKPRTIEELKNMISLEAVDQESGQLLLLDGQPIFVPTLKKKKDSGDGEKEGLVPSLGGDKKDPGFEPISVVVSPPKKYTYVLRFSAFNSWQKEATLSWKLPGQKVSTYRCSLGRDIVYSDKFTTDNIDKPVSTVSVVAVDVDGQELLINGKTSFLVKVEPSPVGEGNPSDNQIQKVVISKTVKKLYLNLNIENTEVKSPVFVSWRYAITTDTYRLFTDEKPTEIIPTESKKRVIAFGVPDDRASRATVKYQIVLYAGYLANNGGLQVNEKSTVQFDLSETTGGELNAVIITKPKVNQYSVKVFINNPLATTSYVGWQLSKTQIPSLVLQRMKPSPGSRVDFVVQPSSTLSKVIILPLDIDDDDDAGSESGSKISKALKDRLTNAISFTVTNGPWKSPAFLNAKEVVTGDLLLNNAPDKLPVASLTVSKVSYVYNTRFSIKNPFDKPITVRWNLNEDIEKKKNWSTTSPRSYTIQPGTTKDVLLQIRFAEQLPKNVELKSLLSLSATLEGVNRAMVLLDGKEKRPLDVYLMGAGNDAGSAGGNDKSTKLSKVVAIKATLAPKNAFRASFRFVNPLRIPVVVTWSFRQKFPSVSYSSPKQINVGPSQEHRQTVTFESSAPPSSLDYQSLRSLIQLTVVGQKSQNALLLNGGRSLVADFEPQGISLPQSKQVLISEQAHRYYVYAMVDNRHNSEISLTLKLLNKDVPMYFENPDIVRIGKSTKRMVRIPVIFLEKPQPDQLQGVIGLSVRKASGQALLVDGLSMVPINLVPESSSSSKEGPIQFTIAPERYFRTTRRFTVFNSLPNAGVTITPRFYVNPAGGDNQQQENSSDDGLKSHLVPADRADSGFFAPSNSRETMQISLLPGDCMELSARSASSSRDNGEVVLIGGKRSYVVCGDSNGSGQDDTNLVLSREGSALSLITFVVDNKWNKDLIVKQTIIRGSPSSSFTGDNQAPVTKEYSIPASKVTGFYYLSVSAADLNSTSRFQFEESGTRLLVILPNGEDHIHVEHYMHQQDYRVTIFNANKMTVRRPAFINLDLTSLIDQPITLHVQNISGHTVKEIQLGKEHRKSNFFLPLSFTGDYPFTYHVVGKMADGTSVFINGRERLAVVPSVSIRPVPLFLSNKEDSKYAPTTYYLDLTVRNKWRNTVYLASPHDGKINTITLMPGQTTHRLFVSSADAKPAPRYFKVVDKDVGNLMKINGGKTHVVFELHPSKRPVEVVIEDYGAVKTSSSYFTVVKFVNQRNEPSLINFDKRLIEVRPKSSEYAISRRLVPSGRQDTVEPIRITATNLDLVPLAVNDENVLEMLPTLKQKLVTVTITRLDQEEQLQENIVFTFINTVSTVAEISLNGEKYIAVPSKSVKSIQLDSVTGRMVRVTAAEKKDGSSTAVVGDLFVNGSSFGVRMLANKLKSSAFVIHTKDAKYNSTYKPYFYNVIFKNNNVQPITVTWDDKNTDDTTLEPGASFVYRDIKMSASRPNDVGFRVIDKSTRREVTMNGRTKFVIEPSKSGLQYDQFSINPDSSTELGFANLAFINTRPYAVIIRSASLAEPVRVAARSYVEKQVRRIAGNDKNDGGRRLEFKVTNTDGGKEFVNGFFGTVFFDIADNNDSQDSKRKSMYIGQKSSNTAWAELAVAHLKLSLDNKRSSPVHVVSNVGNSRTTPTTMLLQPNTKHTLEDILVRLLINDDVIAREIRIRFFDEESGRQLLLDEGENVELPLKLVGKNVYRIEREIRFIDQTKSVYGIRQIELDVMNKNADAVNLKYTTRTNTGGNGDDNQKQKETQIKVNGNSNPLVKIHYPMYAKNERLSLTTDKLFDINGRGAVFDILFSQDVYAMVVLNKKPYNGKLSTFRVSNTIDQPITVRWLLNDIQKSTNISANSHKMFYFYMPDTVKHVGLSAVMAKSNKPVPLNGQDVYQYKLDDGSGGDGVGGDKKNPTTKSLVVKESTFPESPVVTVNLENREPSSVLVNVYFTPSSSTPFASLLVDAKSTRQAFIAFPSGVSAMSMKAFRLDRLFTVNGRYVQELTPGTPGQVARFVIQAPESTPKSQIVEIDVRNNLKGDDARFEWMENGQKKSITVPANDRGVAKVTYSFRPIEFQAYTVPTGDGQQQEKRLAINGQEKFVLQSQNVGKNRVFVHLDEETSNGKSQRYVNLAVRNPLSSPVSLYWTWRDVGYITQIPAGQLTYLQLHVRRGDAYSGISATWGDSRERVTLNGKDILVVKPNERRSGTFETVELGSDKVPSSNVRPLQFVKFRARNQLPVLINLLWEYNGIKRVALIGPGATVDVQQPVSKGDDSNLVFTAFEAGTSNVALVNGDREFSARPSDRKDGSTQELNITPENNVYFYRVYVTDRSVLDAQTNLQWTINGQTVETTVVPGNANNYPITKRFTATKEKQPPRVQLIAFFTDNNNKQQLYLNDMLTFEPAHVTTGHQGDAITIGGAIRKQLYYFRLVVSNLDRRPVKFQWEISERDTSAGGQTSTHARIVPAYYFNYVISGSVEAFEKPANIKLTSFANGTQTQIYTNDRMVHHADIVAQKRPPFQNVFISSYVTSRNTNIMLDNPTSVDVVITWKTRGYKGSVVVPAKSTKYNVSVTLSGGFRDQFVLLQAKMDGNTGGDGRSVLINANKMIRTRLPRTEPLVVDFPYKHVIFNNTLLSPVTVRGKPGAITVTVPAGAQGDIRIPVQSITDTGIVFEAKINGGKYGILLINAQSQVVVRSDTEAVSKLVIGAKEQTQREYFIKLWLTNNHKGEVALKWTERNWQRVFTLVPRYNSEVVLSFNSDQPVTIVGNDVVTNGNVYLNRRRELIVRPSLDVEYATNVVISGEIKMFDYFYRLAINNERNADIEIVLETSTTNTNNNNKKETTRTSVPAMSFKYGINTPLSNLDLGPMQPIRVSATVKGDRTPLYVNGKRHLEVLPSLKDDDATIINVGREIPRRLYYYVFQVSSPIGKAVIMRYKLDDGVSRMTRVPAPKESSPNNNNKGTFYRVAIPYKSLTRPSPITVTAFNEKDGNRPMLINGVKTLTVEPSTDENNKQIAYITSDRQAGQLPANAGPMKDFTYRATVFNPTDQTVTISWRQGKEQNEMSLKVPSGQRTDLEFTEKRLSPVPVELRAYTGSGKESIIPLNQRSVYHLNPFDLSSTQNDHVIRFPMINVGPMTYFFVAVTNQLNIDVVLTYQDANKTQKFSVKANSAQYLVKVKNVSADTDDDSNHRLSAASLKHERPLSVNQKRSLVVRLRDMRVSSQGWITLNVTVSSLPVHYAMQVENMELYPVYMVWNMDGQRGFQQITGQANVKLVIRNENPSSQQPRPISVSCYRPTRSRQLDMFLNNKKTFVALPAYNVDKPQRVVVSSELRQVRQYFIRLELVNQASEPVLLYWSQGKEINFDGTNVNFKRLDASTTTTTTTSRELQLAFPYAVNDMVVLMAISSNNRDRYLNLNNRRRLFVQPTEQPDVMRVIITEKTSKNVYHLNLEIRNYNSNPIQVQYRQAGTSQFSTFNVAPLYHHWFYFAFQLIDGYPMSVQFRVYDTKQRRYLSMHGFGGTFLYQPSSTYSSTSLIVGHTVPAKIYNNPNLPENKNGYPYFLSLHVWNRGERAIRMYWVEPGTTSRTRRYLNVPANSFREYTTVVRVESRLAPWIVIQAERVRYNGRSYTPLIDGYKSSDVIRLQRVKKTSYLLVEHTPKRNVQYYKYGIRFENMASHDVLFKWNEPPAGTERKHYVKPLTSSVYYGVLAYPKEKLNEGGERKPMLRIEAFNPANGERVLLSNEESVSFALSEYKQRTRTVFVEASSATLRMRSFFMGYDITNLYNEPVVLKWNQGQEQQGGGEKRSLVIPPHGSSYYDTNMVSSARPRDVVIRAYLQSSQKEVPIYGRMGYKLSWSHRLGQHSILIGNLESPDEKRTKPTTYQVRLQLKNVAQVPLTLKWEVNGKPASLDIDVGKKIRQVVSVSGLEEPRPIVFKVYRKGGEQTGQINRRLVWEVQPVEKPLLTLLTLDYGQIIPGELQKAKEQCTRQLDVAVLLDSSGTMQGAYKHAKEFIKAFADYYHLGINSTHIGVITFSEQAYLNVAFNAHQEHALFDEDIDSIPFLGYRTRLDLAFKMADERLYSPKYGARDDAEKIVLLMTDGRQNDGDITKEKLELAAQLSHNLLRKKVKILAIGLYGTNTPDEKMLTHLTGDPENVHVVTDYQQLYSMSFLEALTDANCYA